MKNENDLLLLVVPGGITNDEVAQIMRILGQTHDSAKIIRAHSVEELRENVEESPVPEELKNAIIYISGIQPKLAKNLDVARTFYTDEKFRIAYEIIVKYQHMFTDSRVCEMLRDFHITKTKMQNLISMYGDILGI